MVTYLERGREFFFGCTPNGMLKGANLSVRGSISKITEFPCNIILN